ncbi:MAG: hypothetical protein ACK5NT_06905 [Pyrinomonadaceae bacterium]
MVKAKTEKTQEYVHSAGYLTKRTAKTTLHVAVSTAELAENYVQGLYNAGYEANYEGLKIAKGYWDATSEIRQDWIKLFARKGEELIDATAKLNFPGIGDVSKFGKEMISTVTKSVDNLSKTAKANAK